MDLHPILECGVIPASNLWYVLSSNASGDEGQCPSMRVGHTMTQVGNKVYVVGGANPSGAFSDTYVLDLEQLTWRKVSCSGLKPFYEHTAFVAACEPGMIYVFGGADQTKNFNHVLQFDTTTSKWSTVCTTGTSPSPRTYHNGACVDERLIVYSGGQSGTDPVGDRQTYSFDVKTRVWSILSHVRGDTPKPRLGHLMICIDQKLYVHGGMAGSTFYDDLHVLDLSKGLWSNIKQQNKNRPSARAGHGGFTRGSLLYIFGGMNKEGALDDMHYFNTVTQKWSKASVNGPPPASRLDFALCSVSLPVTQIKSESALELSNQIREAGEVLGERLRLDSAGSRSSGSAGSVRSHNGITSAAAAAEKGRAVTAAAAENGRAVTAAAAEKGAVSATAAEKGAVTAAAAEIGAVGSPNLIDVLSADSHDFHSGCHADTVGDCCVRRDDEDVSCRATGADDRVVSAGPRVDVLVVHGGMDVGGEIFDDCFFLLPDSGAAVVS